MDSEKMVMHEEPKKLRFIRIFQLLTISLIAIPLP